MAFTGSVGFDGPLYEIGWARIASMVGTRYSVSEHDAWRVAAVAGERQVSVLAGEGLGCGVLTVTDAAEMLTIPTPTTGTRWYLVVARRVWETNGCTFEVLPGPTTEPIPIEWPADYRDEPGLIDDQPLAWVRASATATTLLLADLRTLPAAGEPVVGTGLLATGELPIYGTVTATGTIIDVAECSVDLRATTKVRIEAIGQWYSASNSAGQHVLRLNDGTEISPRIRQHNEGQVNTPISFYASATRTLRAGRTRILLSASTEKNGGARRIGMVTVNVWKD